MKRIVLLIPLMILTGIVFSQVAPDKYWVRFADKNNSPYSVNNPEEFLSQKAIDRRTAHGIDVIDNDIPVNPSYLTAVENTGAQLLNPSKWFNSVTVKTDDPAVIAAINALPFVMSVEKVSQNTIKESGNKFEPIKKIPDESKIKGITSGQSYSYGQGFNQIDMLNGIELHDDGYDGEGMIIAVLDAGFLNADIISGFDSLWLNNRILGWKDFADPLSPDIFGSHSHGTHVLSTMGAYLPGELVGTAPQAAYWLLRTEDAGSEYLIEELNWASGAEFADSAGVDIINSSLIYTTFDDPSQDHTYSDLDGNTTIITRAADMAVSKGMIVVNSAGNYGNSSWQYIGPPADGDSVFSIGAVNSSGNYVSFSSIGPTYDGRVKPNVVAQGSSSAILSAYSGNVSSSSGTSFSSPITAGMVACLWQAHPDKRNTEILDAIQQHASQSALPDMLLGYGIPDYYQAHSYLSLPVIHEIILEVKTYLEGPFNGSEMNTSLNPMLPLTQPYDEAPFNYSGEEEVLSIPAPDIVDWILLELRDAQSAADAGNGSIVAQRAAFLLQDGSIVDTSGLNQVTFNIAVSDSLYLVIKHRNHLGIMSSTALTNNGNNVYSFDFTISLNKAYGGSSGYKNIEGANFGLVAGDGNADGIIDSQDKSLTWEIKAGFMEYAPGDYNCDGQIDNVDKDDYWIFNTSFSSQLPE